MRTMYSIFRHRLLQLDDQLLQLHRKTLFSYFIQKILPESKLDPYQY
ncbi:unnamed protein product [Schistosoma curassoni]|uniref:Transposase_31 domain-containing protein n=1 Tax=Schistosoma curassoni TaxID=6186 RepID=A0A183JFB1_9TREM|nr:unnamed protein product [Schistosoma curassoni]